MLSLDEFEVTNKQVNKHLYMLNLIKLGVLIMIDDLKNSMILYDMDLNNKKVVVMCFGVPDKYYEDDLQEKDMRDEIMKESKLSIVLDDKEYAESFCNDLRTSIKENEWGK